jgi:hypothetical protein
MLSAYLCCVIICVASAILGQAICSLCGTDRWTWTAPAVGFAALLVVVDATIRLPGGGSVSLGVVIALLAVSTAVIARRIEMRSVALIALPVGVVVAVLASGNYLVNENFGIPGVSMLNDFAGHLPWAEALRTHDSPFSLILPGYPLGCFALAGTLGELPGISVLTGFQGILIATPVLIAITTMALFKRLSLIFRVMAAAVVSLAYLVTSALAEGAFKEPIEALFAIAVVLWLRELGQRDERPRMTAAVPLAVLTAGSVANYSYPGLTWPVLIVVSWLALEVLLRHHAISRACVSRAVVLSLVAVAALAVLAMPEILHFQAFAQGQVTTLKAQTGNIPFALPWSEVLGVWFRDDFRFRPVQPVNIYHVLLVFALAVFVLGVVQACRRRETSLLALLTGTLAVALYTRGIANPYNDAKAMMVLSCAVVLVGMYGLLPPSVQSGTQGRHGQRRTTRLEIAGKLIAVGFAAACLWSASLALRGSYVGPSDHANELAHLRPLLAGHTVLFLAQDDFSAWELRGTRLAYLTTYDIPSLPVSFRAEKAFIVGEPADFDTITAQSLDDFDYVVAPRSEFASVPPANWRPYAATHSYQVWARRGPTAPHGILAEGVGGPGTVLDCSMPGAVALSRTHGSALVRFPPIVLDGGGWQGPVLGRQPGESVLKAGTEAIQQVTLPPGRWQMSLEYTSSTSLAVHMPGLNSALPAVLEHQGPYWPAGDVTSTGKPLTIQVEVHAPPSLATSRYAVLGNMALVRVDIPSRMIPLRAACGRYVDRYADS